MKQVILTGDRPTGRLHVGHYVGSLKERVKLQNSGDYDEVYIMIADAQALTDNAEHPEKVRQNIIQVALDYLACGIDPAKSTIFIQSMVPELTELTFYYMNLVTVARVQRNPTVKAEIQMRNFEASIPVGFFCYPISQAADITAFRATHVPVGEDQLPMLEQCKEIVHKFNTVYGETLTDPKIVLPPLCVVSLYHISALSATSSSPILPAAKKKAEAFLFAFLLEQNAEHTAVSLVDHPGERLLHLFPGILRQVAHFPRKPFPDNIIERFAENIRLPNGLALVVFFQQVVEKILALLFGSHNRADFRLDVHLYQVHTGGAGSQAHAEFIALLHELRLFQPHL